MKIVITGADGLLGRHVRLSLGARERYKSGVVLLDRKAFCDESIRNQAVRGADAVIHCAGVNRATDDEVEKNNPAIAAALVDSLQLESAKPHVFFANSTHKNTDTPYGRGKTAAHEVLQNWAQRHDAKYTELVLPHIFGEGGRPNYNSAIHTFCYQLANGESLKVNAGGELELLHAQDVAAAIAKALEAGATGSLRLDGEKMSVVSAAEKLSDFHRKYCSDIIPDLRTLIDLRLFNTLRSFMYPSFYPKSLTLHSDDRGTLFEGVKNLNGGQVFLSTTRPGITRGNHYHFNKVERFLVVDGDAVIRIRHMLSDQIQEFHVSGSAPAFVDMPTLHTHSITNTGDRELLTLFWSNEIFDPDNPDTVHEPVIQERS